MYVNIYLYHIYSLYYQRQLVSIAPQIAMACVFRQNLGCEWRASKDRHNERGKVMKGKRNSRSAAKALGHRGSPQNHAATCPTDSVSVPYRHPRTYTLGG